MRLFNIKCVNKLLAIYKIQANMDDKMINDYNYICLIKTRAALQGGDMQILYSSLQLCPKHLYVLCICRVHVELHSTVYIQISLS